MKTAIVTGGAGGIGREIIKDFIKLDYKIVFLDFNESLSAAALEEFTAAGAKEGQVQFLKVDLTKGEQVREVYKKAVQLLGGQLDVAINNAGMIGEANWEFTININLTAAVRCTYLAMNYMSKEKGFNGGTIINTVSIAGVYVRLFPVYNAAKHGIGAFTQTFAAIPGFYEAHGIRVVGVCPAVVATGLWKPLDDGFGFDLPNGAKEDDLVCLEHLKLAKQKENVEIQAKTGFHSPAFVSKIFTHILKHEDKYHGELICLPNGSNKYVTFDRTITFSELNETVE